MKSWAPLRKTFLIFTLSSLGAPAWAWTDLPPQVSERNYLVIAYDGTEHLLTMRYEAGLRWRKWQTGRASKPGKLRFKDDRQCHYEINLSHNKRASSSYDIATGRQDSVLNQIEARLEGPTSANASDLNSWANRYLFGPKINTVEEAERIDDLVEAVDWSVDSPLDALEKPFAALLVVAESGFSGLRVFGNSLGRLVGLRTGINCGEAEGIINAQVGSARNVHYSSAAKLEEVDYYFSIRQLRQDWAYLNFSTGQFVGAAWVTPVDVITGYETIFAYEAQRLADEVMGSDLTLTTAERDTINGFEVGPKLYADVLNATLPRPLETLETRYAQNLPAIEKLSDEVLALLPPDAASRVYSRQMTFQTMPDQGDASLSILMAANPITSTVTVPNCFVPHFGRAEWVGTLADDPLVAGQIRAKWSALISILSELGDEALRIEAFAALLPDQTGAPYAQRARVILDALEAHRGVVDTVERFDDARSRCEATVISADPMGAMLEILNEQDWERARDLIGDGGVTDPPRPDLMREVVNESLQSIDKLNLPESIADFEALDQRLGLEVMAQP